MMIQKNTLGEKKSQWDKSKQLLVQIYNNSLNILCEIITGISKPGNDVYLQI